MYIWIGRGVLKVNIKGEKTVVLSKGDTVPEDSSIDIDYLIKNKLVEKVSASDLKDIEKELVDAEKQLKDLEKSLKKDQKMLSEEDLSETKMSNAKTRINDNVSKIEKLKEDIELLKSPLGDS